MQHSAATLSRADWRLILLASLGGALEFYDFVVYSQFARYIGLNFFPNDDEMVSLIVSFSVFAVGYFARPLGGIFFSHIGDRIGRRRVLIVTILAMSAATAGIGLLPTYAEWGITASILLVLLRIVQGFCLGGELPGAISYVVETAPRRSGFSVGVVFFCVNTGVALAALLNLVVHEMLTPEEIQAWGWRIGFLVGGGLGLVSFVLRLKLEESREFARIRAVGRRLGRAARRRRSQIPGRRRRRRRDPRRDGRLQRPAVRDAGVPAADDGLRSRARDRSAKRRADHHVVRPAVRRRGSPTASRARRSR